MICNAKIPSSREYSVFLIMYLQVLSPLLKQLNLTRCVIFDNFAREGYYLCYFS